MRLDRGTVLLIDLEPTRGHEPRGVRPGIVVSDAEVAADQRFPLLAVVPLSGTPREGALYPAVGEGPSGLTKASYALTDQVRSLDKRRVRRWFGRISGEEMRAVDEGLALYLGLPPPTEPGR